MSDTCQFTYGDMIPKPVGTFDWRKTNDGEARYQYTSYVCFRWKRTAKGTFKPGGKLKAFLEHKNTTHSVHPSVRASRWCESENKRAGNA